MPRFEITGKGTDSGRPRRRVYSASNKDEAMQLAEKDGTSVEGLKELPPDPPTEPQLEYAKHLNLSIPQNATKQDVSDLISLKVDNDKPSTPRHREFARRFGVEVTEHVGKRALFDRIQSALVVPGRELELLSWFTYRVYRELSAGADDAPIQSPDDPVIQDVAARLATDEQVIKSVRRYEGRELIWFGEWTAPDGFRHSGGSNRTAAYSKASSLLKERLSSTRSSPRKVPTAPSQSEQSRTPQAAARGCLSVFALAIVPAVGLLAYVVW